MLIRRTSDEHNFSRAAHPLSFTTHIRPDITHIICEPRRGRDHSDPRWAALEVREKTHEPGHRSDSLADSLRPIIVLSFMSQFGGPPRSPTQPSSPTSAVRPDPPSTSSSQQIIPSPARESGTPPRARLERPSSRPMSVVQTYQPPLLEVAQDTIPELQPIFTFLNSHSNKLFQEGYFLKLNDLDSST